VAKITNKKQHSDANYKQLFAQNLSAVVEKFGWSQTEFGKRIKTSQVQAGKYLAGKTNLSFDVLERIEKATGVPIADFFRKDKGPDPVVRSLSEEVRDTIFEATQQGSHKLLDEFVAKVFPVVAKMQHELNTNKLTVKEEPTEKIEAFVNRLFDEFGVSAELCLLLDEGAEEEVLRVQFMRDFIHRYLEAGGKTAEGMRELISEFAAERKGKR
jgi:transcriptional regulator with XRE-family HTH domain